MRKAFALAAALVPGSVAVLPSSTLAQSWANTVWNQLQSQYDDASGDGYESLYYVVGKLREGEKTTWSLFLDEGDYEIRGACDGDCHDVDLRIFARATDEEISDTEAGDEPILGVEIMSAGTFDIEVEMYECAAEPCYYGIGVFYFGY